MDTNFELEELAEQMGLHDLLVTTKDRLQDQHPPVSCIVNLQDDFDSKGKDLQGTHWTAVYIEDRKCCYFDPIGFPPASEIQIYLYHLRPYPYNEQQIQDEKNGYCGRYCIFFLWFMKRNDHIKDVGERLSKFLMLFSIDPKDNLKLLQKYLPE